MCLCVCECMCVVGRCENTVLLSVCPVKQRGWTGRQQRMKTFPRLEDQTVCLGWRASEVHYCIVILRGTMSCFCTFDLYIIRGINLEPQIHSVRQDRKHLEDTCVFGPQDLLTKFRYRVSHWERSGLLAWLPCWQRSFSSFKCKFECDWSSVDIISVPCDLLMDGLFFPQSYEWPGPSFCPTKINQTRPLSTCFPNHGVYERHNLHAGICFIMELYFNSDNVSRICM